MVLAQRWMGRNPSAPEATFLLVMLHTGTMFAVLVYFLPRWRALVGPAAAGNPAGASAGSRLRFPVMVLLAMAVTGVLGFGLIKAIELVLFSMSGEGGREVEYLFRNLPLMAASLFAVGLAIIAAGARGRVTSSAPLTPASAA